MPNSAYTKRASELLQQLKETGQIKPFQSISSPMGPTAVVEGVGEVVILCSNNYLGLADHPEVIAAGIEGLKKYGAGTASVRFICGSFDCHRELEQTIARFVGTEAALSYVSCWNANEAVFPTLTEPGDVILSDELNHASIIDSMRLVAKGVEKSIYRHSDLEDLENKLKEHADKAVRWIVTDGVFSMEGDVAPLPELVELSNRYNALLVLDDSHGIGVVGKSGRGLPDAADVLGQVDIITGTLGKALGGGAGGYVAASQETIDLLQQRGRPSLFSNALPCTIACSAKKAIDIVEREPERIERLHANMKTIRDGLLGLGFDCPESETGILPIIIGDEAKAIAAGKRLLELGVMVVGFAFPVVPMGTARLRVQVSAALEASHIERALDAFAKL